MLLPKTLTLPDTLPSALRKLLRNLLLKNTSMITSKDHDSAGDSVSDSHNPFYTIISIKITEINVKTPLSMEDFGVHHILLLDSEMLNIADSLKKELVLKRVGSMRAGINPVIGCNSSDFLFSNGHNIHSLALMIKAIK